MVKSEYLNKKQTVDGEESFGMTKRSELVARRLGMECNDNHVEDHEDLNYKRKVNLKEILEKNQEAGRNSRSKERAL